MHPVRLLDQAVHEAETKSGEVQAVRNNEAAPINGLVIVLDTLSRILPDHTYVTELRVEGNKLRLTGVTKDAPSLIGLIEGSGRFRGATFFAPTTQLPSEAGEHFHIEADIQLLVPPHS